MKLAKLAIPTAASAATPSTPDHGRVDQIENILRDHSTDDRQGEGENPRSTFGGDHQTQTSGTDGEIQFFGHHWQSSRIADDEHPFGSEL